MNNEVVDNKKSNVGIIIAVVAVALVIGIVLFFIFGKNNKDVAGDNKLDAATLNTVLNYLGIDSEGKPNNFTDDIIVRLYSGENYDAEEFVNEYALVNNLFDSEEYVNDKISGCEAVNDNDGLTRKCYLLSKDKFNMITELYNIDYTFDDVNDQNKIGDKYLYKYQVAVTAVFTEYKYVVNSAIYEDEAKTKIVLDTTRIETDLETNSTNTEGFKFYLTKNGDSILFNNIEAINN